MDRILELALPWNQASIDGAEEQTAELLAECLEPKNLSKLPSNPDLVNNVVAHESLVKSRKYQMDKFVLKGELARYGKAVYYSADFKAKSVMLKAYSGEESNSLPWREVELLRYLKHPNVLELYGAFRCGRSFAVLEMCSGNLLNIWPLSPRETLRASMQLVNGVEFLHSKSVVHANLSPRVLLFTSLGTLKISEFSGAIALQVGQDSYVSEELLGDPAYLDVAALTKNQYSRQTDVHSCACIIFEMELQQPLLGDRKISHDRKFFSDSLTLGYPIMRPDGVVLRKPVKDILNGSIHSEILLKMIEGKVAIQEFLVDPTVTSRNTLFRKLFGDWEGFYHAPSWDMKPVDEMNKPVHLCDNFWKFYYDNENDVSPNVLEPDDPNSQNVCF